MDDGELIKLIERHPILYDRDIARSVGNAAQKDAAWKTISSKMGASERACITRWKSIRDRFGKEFRRFQERPDEPTYWDMFQRLLFLKNHYKQGAAAEESLDRIRFEPREQRKRPKVDPSQQDKRRREQEQQQEEEEDCEQDGLLIKLVKLHPVLYDRHKIRVSKNLTAKNLAWREISENLNLSEELCYKRWKKLRDRFAREYRDQQIDQAKPITWRYFNELLFLGRHFRKGVPLILENIKRRGRPPKSNNCSGNLSYQPTSASINVISSEQVWGADYPYSPDNDELEMPYNESEEIEILSDAEQETSYDFVFSGTTPHSQGFVHPQQQLQVTTTTPAMNEEIIDTLAHNSDPAEGQCLSTPLEDGTPRATSEKLLMTVITNMETVLHQSRELQANFLQEQQDNEQERKQQEFLPSGKSLLAKAKMLLDELNAEARSSAERKIIQFLCQCQIRALDGEDIEDVAPCQMLPE
ncbi:hypothetical protein KR018_010887 [Drosophila ironensis]|nr:hypothetical protein KR018_010887 [Drosophila ironensis]